MLSAGGTGGHLFPAQALAGELVRRGRDIVVMTDARFANYATQFPGARIETVPSSPFNAVAAPFKIAAGIAIAFAKLLRLKPAAVIGFGGYPSVPVMLAANLARPAHRHHRAECRGRPRQPAGDEQGEAGGRRFSHRPLRARRSRPRSC